MDVVFQLNGGISPGEPVVTFDIEQTTRMSLNLHNKFTIDRCFVVRLDLKCQYKLWPMQVNRN